MGNVALDFKPSVPVFDANVALGRRHDRDVDVDNVTGTLQAMSQAGINKALVYASHSVSFDSQEGNELLSEMIQGQPRLVPQFVCNPPWDHLDSFALNVKRENVSSIKMFPLLDNYPFTDWVVNSWMEWLTSEHIPRWIIADQVDPVTFYDTIKVHPNRTVVLSEVHYSHYAWVMPLLRSLPNLCIEISRFFITDGISRLIDTIGEKRILYGSRFPDSSMNPQLYHLHHCGLSESALTAICSGNLNRLLNME